MPPRGTRPTTDRVRESLFNILTARLDLTGLAVLDLYAGSGALGPGGAVAGCGVGAVRGVRSAHRAVLARNIGAVGLPGATLRRGAVRRCWRRGRRAGGSGAGRPALRRRDHVSRPFWCAGRARLGARGERCGGRACRRQCAVDLAGRLVAMAGAESTATPVWSWPNVTEPPCYRIVMSGAVARVL